MGGGGLCYVTLAPWWLNPQKGVKEGGIACYIVIQNMAAFSHG